MCRRRPDPGSIQVTDGDTQNDVSRGTREPRRVGVLGRRCGAEHSARMTAGDIPASAQARRVCPRMASMLSIGQLWRRREPAMGDV